MRFDGFSRTIKVISTLKDFHRVSFFKKVSITINELKTSGGVYEELALL